ncbi:hypothetical protein LINPERHAP1_LOCUS37293 [Linum perenne]
MDKIAKQESDLSTTSHVKSKTTTQLFTLCKFHRIFPIVSIPLLLLLPQQTKTELVRTNYSNKESKSKFIPNRFFKPIPGLPHQIRAQSKHQNTKLHLIQSSVAVKIPFLHHPVKLPVGQVLETQYGGVPLQTSRCNHPFVLIHQQLEPIAELLD